MTPVASWHALTIEATWQQLETSAAGLTSAEAGERLARFGRNEITHGGLND